MRSRLRESLRTAIGDVVFGMEDGAVSVAGLVTGVSASTSDSWIVVLAGATGAVAGAVSMMAGRYLDVQSTGHRADALLAATRTRVHRHPDEFLERASQRLRDSGFTQAECDVVLGAMRREPEALVNHVAAYELAMTVRPESPPWVHAAWMFAADLIAAGIPVFPFFFWSIESARIISLLVTGALMGLLGLLRGHIGGLNIWRAALQTMAIAGAAALAGVIIGQWVALR